MKIVQVMTTTEGGAARAAINLHCGLREIGVSSDILALKSERLPDGGRVFGPPKGVISGIERAWKRAVERADFRPFRLHQRASGQARWERFSPSRNGWGASLAAEVAGYDIVHLHWVSDFVDLRTFFAALPPRVRVVWTMHDLWAFTGGCHFPEGCDRYMQACGECPQWGSEREGDFSRRSWRDRQVGYAGLAGSRLRLVSPSRWLAGCAAGSSLFSSRSVEVIPNGIDLEAFVPVDRAQARSRLGVPGDVFVALFLADSGGNRRKGLAVLEDAVRGMPADGRRLLLVAGGEAIGSVPGWEVLPLGYVSGAERLSEVYSAADVFVHPALEDNLPSTVLEALACGTPVAAFRIGGLPEMITAPGHGVLCEPTAAALREVLAATEQWKHDPARRAACRAQASEFSIARMVGAYREVYGSFPE